MAILYPGGSSAWLEEVSELCRREWECTVQSLAFLEAEPEGTGFDLRQPEGARQAALKLSEDPSLAGLVILLDDSFIARLQGMADLSGLLAGFFPVLQALGAAPRKKFSLALHRSPDEAGEGELLSQGLLGLFLSAALEYPDVLFRTIRLDQETKLPLVLRQALDPKQPVIETYYQQGQLMTTAGRVALAEGTNEPGLVLNRSDVVVFSGGGYGITTHLVKSLAPFSPRVVLLGRTAIDLDDEISKLLLAEEPSEKALRWQIMQQKPDISQEDLKRELARLFQARQVMQSLEELRAMGMEVAYLSCDVTDPEQVQETVKEIIRRYGRIDGLVHGAGVLRDKLLAHLNPEEVAPVLDVKCNGAWNLFDAACASRIAVFRGPVFGRGHPGEPRPDQLHRGQPDDVGSAEPDSSAPPGYPVQSFESAAYQRRRYGRRPGSPSPAGEDGGRVPGTRGTQGTLLPGAFWSQSQRRMGHVYVPAPQDQAYLAEYRRAGAGPRDPPGRHHSLCAGTIPPH